MSLKYDLIKNKITIRMVPRKNGQKVHWNFPHLDEDTLHVVIGEMCAVFCVGTKNNSVVTYHTLEALDIMDYDFMSDMYENAVKNNPVVMKSLAEIQSDKTEFESWMDITPLDVFALGNEEKDKSIYVVSNAEKQFGASALVYPGFLKQAAKTIGGSFFVLPVSVHEIVLVDDKVAESADYLSTELSNMLFCKEVLKPDDCLSDVLYHYDAKADRFETSWHYAQRVALNHSK